MAETAVFWGCVEAAHYSGRENTHFRSGMRRGARFARGAFARPDRVGRNLSVYRAAWGELRRSHRPRAA